MFKTIVIHVYCFMSPCTDLSTQLEAIRARYGLPSLSAALIYEGQLGDVAAVGLRASNKLETVTLEDAYQLGSISKGFTATMIARLVEQGILRFDMTLGEVLPDVSMLPEYKSITLQLLLTHRSGIQRDVKPPEGEVQSARKSYLEMALKGPRGQQKFVYSNVGFVIAAIIAERMTGRVQFWVCNFKRSCCPHLVASFLEEISNPLDVLEYRKLRRIEWSRWHSMSFDCAQ
jgi:CubicO group peptidase (beta-lactamase class C family)